MRTKNKIKNYLKLGIFLFGISFAMLSCMEDKEPLIKEKSNLILTHSSFKKVNKQAKVRKITKKLLSFRSEKSNSTNFVIDTTSVQIVSSEYFTNYTFIVQTNEENDDVLNNYVLTIFNDSIFHQMLITYPIIYGDEIDYDLNNINIEPIEGEMLIQKKICDGYEVDSWVTTDHDCASGQHSGDGEVDDCDYGSGPNGPYTTGRWITTCINAGEVYIDEYGGGGAFNPNHGGSNNNNSDDEVEETVDIPVIPFNRVNHCRSLKKLLETNNANIKPSLQYIKTNITAHGEAGFVMKKSSSNVYSNSNVTSSTIGTVNHNVGGSIYGAGHCHPLDGIGIFSWADVNNLYKVYRNATPTNRTSAVYFVASQIPPDSPNVYAIKIDNYTTFHDKLSADRQNIIASNPALNSNSTEKQIIKAMHNKLAVNYTNDNNLERVFLEIYAGHGISLYKANGNLTNWSKLTLPLSAQGTGTVIETPCN